LRVEKLGVVGGLHLLRGVVLLVRLRHGRGLELLDEVVQPLLLRKHRLSRQRGLGFRVVLSVFLALLLLLRLLLDVRVPLRQTLRQHARGSRLADD